MSAVYMGAALLAFVLITAYITDFKWRPKIEHPLFVIIFTGFMIRLLATGLSMEFSSDIATFKYWANQLYRDGLSSMYLNDGFSDYPPGYMYVLYLTGFLKDFLRIESGYGYTLLIKLPAILFDLFTAALIYKIAGKKLKPSLKYLVVFLIILNPATILNSSVWGQVDSVHSFLLLFSLYLLTQNDYKNSYLLFALCVLIKPQSLIMSPIFLFSIYTYFKDYGRGREQILNFLSYVAICILAVLILMVPFINGLNIMPIINQYVDTLSSYPYATINAYNFYALVGGNWLHIDSTFLFMPYYVWGTFAIVSITFFSIYLLWRNRTKSNYFFVAAFLFAATFMFSIKMHERYLFPALVFLPVAWIYKRDKRTLLLYGGFTITFFINCLDILMMYHTDADMGFIQDSLPVISFLNVLLILFMIFTAFASYPQNEEEQPATDESPVVLSKEPKPLWHENFSVRKTRTPSPLTRKDAIIMATLTLVYGVIAFYNLGDTAAPQTVWTAGEGDAEIFELEQETHLSRLQYYIGPRHNKDFTIDISTDGDNWVEVMAVNTKGVFSWKEEAVDTQAKFLRLNALSDELMLIELGLRDENDNLIPVISNSPLFDEQALVPMEGTYRNSTYFDEIYHARTAYEFLNNLKVYEWTHPPLGKVIISLGISIFGMTPFGWRFMGALFGVLMVPLIYLFARRISGKTCWAAFGAILFTFDFMHYAQTRIATIDSYTTFFVMAMYYFMYRYICMNFYDTGVKKTLLPLGLSGLFMGLGVACKWQGIYAGAGLAVIFFLHLYRRYQEYRYGKLHHITEITSTFKKNTLITIGFCMVAFVAVPLLIYGLSYIPYTRTPEFSGISDILKNQGDMWEYHSKLVSTHSYASPWWQWPIMKRPVFYYSHAFEGNLRAGISTFGNPLVWWMGIPAFFYCIRSLSKKHSTTILFLIIGYMAQYLPWVLVSRTTYIYHYFPSVPFIVLMIMILFKEYVHQKNKKITYAYIGFVVLLFILFYPVLSGMPVSADYVEHYLRWFSSWQLIIR